MTWSIVIKLPLKGLNGRMHIQRKRKVVDENMKKYNEDDVSYCIMRKLRQHFVKLGNYVMRLTFIVLKENN